MRTILRIIVNNPLIVVLAVVLTGALGVYAVLHLPVELFQNYHATLPIHVLWTILRHYYILVQHLLTTLCKLVLHYLDCLGHDLSLLKCPTHQFHCLYMDTKCVL